jgi:hypothetical protein
MAKSRLLLIIEEDAGRARPLLEESLTLLRQTDDARSIVVTICHLAQATRRLGEHGRADALFEEGVELARRHGDPWVLALASTIEGTTCSSIWVIRHAPDRCWKRACRCGERWERSAGSP